MTLFASNLLAGLLLILVGVPLILRVETAVAILKRFPRSMYVGYALFAGASIWFLYNVSQMSSSDAETFGGHRAIPLIGFATIATLALRFVPDFLSVRALAVLMLLSAKPMLGAAYMQFDKPQRLPLVSLMHVGLVLALMLGAWPYRFRDFVDWVTRRNSRLVVLGTAMTIGGLTLCGIAFTFR